MNCYFGTTLLYGDYDDVKKICKSNSMAGGLGGKNVLEKHFKNLTFQELRKSFFDGVNDEFIFIYDKIISKI